MLCSRERMGATEGSKGSGPEPTSFGMTHPEDEEEHHDPSQPRSASPKPTVMMEDSTKRLTALSNPLEAAPGRSTSLQARRTAPQSAIPAAQSKANAHENLVQTA